jgi:hypothetical protein
MKKRQAADSIFFELSLHLRTIPYMGCVLVENVDAFILRQ